MKFSELHQLLNENLGIDHLADIARELNVSPQAVSNWKSRDRVPYKYVIQLRDRIEKEKNTQIIISDSYTNSQHEQVDKEGLTNSTFSDNQLITLTDILLIISKKLRLILTLGLAAGLFGYIYLTSRYIPIYTTNSKLVLGNHPNNTQENSGIASAMGLSNNISTQPINLASTSLLPELINSRTFAQRLLKEKFYTKKYGKELSLLAILTYGDEEPKKDLNTLISDNSNLPQNMISINKPSNQSFHILSVSTFEPQLSFDIANVVLKQLEELNRLFKTKEIIDKREFIENRIATIQSDLINFEEKLKQFRLSNRNLGNSPTLQLQQDRIARDTQIHSAMFLTLKQELELLKIEEVQSKTLIQILDEPFIPIRPSNMMSKSIIILFTFIGFFIGIIYSIVYNYFINSSELERQKLFAIRNEIINTFSVIFLDRKVNFLISFLLLSGLLFLLLNKSGNPVLFNRYSMNALVIIVFYLLICGCFILLSKNFKKIKIF